MGRCTQGQAAGARGRAHVAARSTPDAALRAAGKRKLDTRESHALLPAKRPHQDRAEARAAAAAAVRGWQAAAHLCCPPPDVIFRSAARTPLEVAADAAFEAYNSPVPTSTQARPWVERNPALCSVLARLPPMRTSGGQALAPVS